MKYRQLLPGFVSYLESTMSSESNWPKYKALAAYCRATDWVFTDREYTKLRKTGFAREETVIRLVQFLQKYSQKAIIDFIPTLHLAPDEAWVDMLSQFADGSALRDKDYVRGSTWRNSFLVFGLWDPQSEEKATCRTEDAAWKLAESAYLQITRDLLPARYRNSPEQICIAGRKAFRQSASEFCGRWVAFWKQLPECMWVIHKKQKPLGGSIVLPLTESAFQKLSLGQLRDTEINPESDLQLPSRNLWIAGISSFPDVVKPRVPGVLSAMLKRGLLQHGASLIGDDPLTTAPLNLMVATTPNDSRAAKRFGYRPTGHTLKSLDFPVLTLTTPAPETTRFDFSSAAAASASLVGTYWRLARKIPQ